MSGYRVGQIIFIFINRLLRDTDLFTKLLLTELAVFTQCFQIFDQMTRASFLLLFIVARKGEYYVKL